MTKQAILIDEQIALEIIQHEAIVRQAYKDSRGIWTWGVGVTDASGHNVTRYIDNPQSLNKVLSVYLWLLETKYAKDVIEAFEGYPLTKSEFAAALSFHWNTGAIKKAMWVKQIKAGKRQEAYSSFMNYQKPASIKARREAERKLFFNAVWSNKDGMVREYTRVTAAHTPDWKSGKRIDVRPTLAAILKPLVGVDMPAKPAYNSPSAANWWSNLKAWLLRLFK